MLVVELIPSALGERLRKPAHPGDRHRCRARLHGPVLVLHDMLGVTRGRHCRASCQLHARQRRHRRRDSRIRHRARHGRRQSRPAQHVLKPTPQTCRSSTASPSCARALAAMPAPTPWACHHRQPARGISLISWPGALGPMVASIFVNRLQFRAARGLRHYPRTLERLPSLLAPAGHRIVVARRKGSLPEPQGARCTARRAGRHPRRPFRPASSPALLHRGAQALQRRLQLQGGGSSAEGLPAADGDPPHGRPARAAHHHRRRRRDRPPRRTAIYWPSCPRSNGCLDVTRSVAEAVQLSAALRRIEAATSATAGATRDQLE